MLNAENRFRLSPDGRLSFTPRGQEWRAMVDEAVALLGSIHENPAAPVVIAGAKSR